MSDSKELLYVFGVLLASLILISSFGGGLRYVEPFFGPAEQSPQGVSESFWAEDNASSVHKKGDKSDDPSYGFAQGGSLEGFYADSAAATGAPSAGVNPASATPAVASSVPLTKAAPAATAELAATPASAKPPSAMPSVPSVVVSKDKESFYTDNMPSVPMSQQSEGFLTQSSSVSDYVEPFCGSMYAGCGV